MNRNRLISELIYYNPYDFNDTLAWLFSEHIAQMVS